MLLPSDNIPDSKLLSNDKLAHLGVFMIHCVLLNLAMDKTIAGPKRKIKGLYIALTISIVYGAGLEFLQQFIPGRMTDIYDLLANTLGAVIGTIVFITFNKISLRFLN